MTTLTIKVDYSLKELKEKYVEYHPSATNQKITKQDIAIWLSSLVESDIFDLSGDDDY